MVEHMNKSWCPSLGVNAAGTSGTSTDKNLMTSICLFSILGARSNSAAQCAKCSEDQHRLQYAERECEGEESFFGEPPCDPEALKVRVFISCGARQLRLV